MTANPHLAARADRTLTPAAEVRPYVHAVADALRAAGVRIDTVHVDDDTEAAECERAFGLIELSTRRLALTWTDIPEPDPAAGWSTFSRCCKRTPMRPGGSLRPAPKALAAHVAAYILPLQAEADAYRPLPDMESAQEGRPNFSIENH